jgi:hypothetical protein
VETKCYMAGLLGAALLLGVGCASIEVHTDWDREADFSQFETWSYAPKPQKTTGVAALDDDTLFTNRVREAVSRVLQANGFPQVDAGRDKPDFLVAFFPVVEDKTSVSTVNDYYGYGGGGAAYGYHGGWGYGPGGFGSHTVVDHYQEGTLVVDVVRGSDGDLVWRGSATARLSDKSTPEKETALVNEAVEKIFEHFPPGKKK